MTSMCPLKFFSCFSIPLWWLTLGEVPLVSPIDSHCDSEGVTAVEDAALLCFYGEPRGIEEVPENPRRSSWRVRYPTAFSAENRWKPFSPMYLYLL